jgi:hypothetical protein
MRGWRRRGGAATFSSNVSGIILFAESRPKFKPFLQASLAHRSPSSSVTQHWPQSNRPPSPLVRYPRPLSLINLFWLNLFHASCLNIILHKICTPVLLMLCLHCMECTCWGLRLAGRERLRNRSASMDVVPQKIIKEHNCYCRF